MNVSEFIIKWRPVALTERSAAQQHFLDLCEVFDHPKPADADPTGDWFTFERGAAKHGGGEGWADVWKREFFGWEYKGKYADSQSPRDLNAAYDQLLQYREALENPPLLVVCDMDRLVVHTNFTATASIVHEVPLAHLDEPRNLEIIRAVFHDPEKLKPGVTSEAITTKAASHLADVAQGLRNRGLDPHEVAHFLDRLIFCLFAEDIGLLPGQVFTRVVEKTRHDPQRFAKLVGDLFDAMAHGGDFGADAIRHFNGNLFTAGLVLDLTAEEIGNIHEATTLDWSAVDPSIFGTLFERGMDPAKRSQLGAHYTSREDIETLVEPVVMQPLRREWEEVRATVESLLITGKKPKSQIKNPKSKTRMESDVMLHRFLTRLANVKVLDPACGSGNFLYVTLQKLKDLEKEVIVFAMERGFSGYLPLVGPWQLYGIEVSPYAHDLAQMTVWIGYLQWTRANGFGITDDPILRPSNNIQCMDAIINISDFGFAIGDLATDDADHEIANQKSKIENPHEPEWPTVDCIVGNPPFLGDKKMRAELGDEYVETLRKLYAGRIPGQSDLCCYWFEKARQQIAEGKCKRAGLLATQGIRGGANREVLKRIKETGDIFFAESDRPWILDGANVHVSMVGFDDGADTNRRLDGKAVLIIHADLSSASDITQARELAANKSLSFLGSCKGGAFNISEPEALNLLNTSGNPHGKPNSDIVRPVFNSEDLMRRTSPRWIIDNAALELSEASLYEGPHGIVEVRVKPARDVNRDQWLRQNWWRPQRMRPEMREKALTLHRFIVTTTTSKHRIFVWLRSPALPDHQLIVFARSDDYFFGVLHSRLHEVWARVQGTQLRERESGFRYTPTTCFETFPFPDESSCNDRQGVALPDAGLVELNSNNPGLGSATPQPSASESAIAEAARELNALRENWLNPPEWTKEEILEFPGSVDGPWSRYIENPKSEIANQRSHIGLVRYPRLVPRGLTYASALAKRTLTNLYNERPTWLDLAHRKLDEAVFAAYGWDAGLTDEEILEMLLELNLERASS